LVVTLDQESSKPKNRIFEAFDFTIKSSLKSRLEGLFPIQILIGNT